MKCERTIERFLQSDNGTMPLSVLLHTLFCPRCREEVRALRGAMDSLAGGTPYRIGRDITDEVMVRVRATPLRHDNVSPIKWLFSGLMIFSSIFFLTFSDSYIWLRSYFGRGFEVPLSIILGAAVTVYVAMFVGTHLEEMKEYFNIRE